MQKKITSWWIFIGLLTACQASENRFTGSYFPSGKTLELPHIIVSDRCYEYQIISGLNEIVPFLSDTFKVKYAHDSVFCENLKDGIWVKDYFHSGILRDTALYESSKDLENYWVVLLSLKDSIEFQRDDQGLKHYFTEYGVAPLAGDSVYFYLTFSQLNKRLTKVTISSKKTNQMILMIEDEDLD